VTTGLIQLKVKMRRELSYMLQLCLLLLVLDATDSLGIGFCDVRPSFNSGQQTRRDVLGKAFAAASIGLVGIGYAPRSAFAAADCMADCLKNCKKIAPKDPDYCTMNCNDYCAQDDRTDGLSGSVSASSGEVGILGGTFGQGTVPKGDDRPPSFTLPGLDFTSSSGKQLIGY
jgi:hypothetical protein